METVSRLLPVLIVLWLAVVPGVRAAGLGELRDDLGIAADPAAVSVSGISSGGYMAHQYHLAHSAKVMGAGIVAGGPYACARVGSTWCDYVPTWYGFWLEGNVCQALHVCSSVARSESPAWLGAWLYFGPPGHEFPLEQVRAAAADGRIDDLDGLAGDRVWLLSGGEDRTVPQELTGDVERLYRMLLPAAATTGADTALVHVRRGDLAHAMPVDMEDHPDDCDRSGPPFINDCSLDAAGQLLTHIHRLPTGPEADPPFDAWDRGALLAFDQRPFFDTGEPSVSLAAEGHLYVPDACRGGAPCPLHVAFHGCRQTEPLIRAACGADGCSPGLFYEDAGYNPWAERHALVILYPQTRAWGEPGDASRNPRACWDWWGYSGDGYDTRGAPQIRAVDAMVDCLTGARACP